MAHLILILLGSLNVVWADAFPQLPAFPAGPANPIDNAAKPEPKCDEIVSRLEDYTQKVQAHNQGVVGFLGQVAGVGIKWQELLFPLEKTTTPIPENAFISLKDNSVAIEQVTFWATDNNAHFADELDKILT